MNHIFKPLNLLRDGLTTKKTAHLHIKSNTVTWDLYFVNGKLQYAQHSLQSEETIKYCLISLAPHSVVKINSANSTNKLQNLQLLDIVNELFSSHDINSTEKILLIKELSQDALESFLCLKYGEYQWNDINESQSLKLKETIGENLFELASVIKTVQIRLQQWQKLSPFISSPYHRLVFVNPSLLKDNVPNGTLSPTILMKLIKFMKGLTIRQLSFLLKQNDVKLANLLFPYIQHNIIKVYPPNLPHDKLPTISSITRESNNVIPLRQISSNQENITEKNNSVSTSVTNNNLSDSSLSIPSKSLMTKDNNHQKYKIMCIDDSPTMLETMKSYLESDSYNVVTVDNPMKSLSSLFDSKPDLILMDLSMPGINGNRLSQILKCSPVFKNVPIIIVSGNTNVLNQEVIEEIGAKDFLAKPFVKNDLLAIVNQYLQPIQSLTA
ncbi:MAG: response regulator [Cyanobacteria bacterium]|nr:response regulator [Cyanobacteria bacterium CG_2015-16_32_12]NCO76841.1 response regulator [Cyanobacteria bacterium CG_2015-22_32_23]NCQ04440.1 response regulator [Cyanobacteria bacterium CG_2015-09_32_10]NCQ40402.1 response regulator [Cyanobacteria bacterium CG_2015-04_32_10]NCS84490.1 response regulator [Cyanobacteria bacterium CG_2015-02_32_10]